MGPLLFGFLLFFSLCQKWGLYFWFTFLFLEPEGVHRRHDFWFTLTFFGGGMGSLD